MTEDINPEVIKRTQDSLKKFIKKPPLTEKLLKKPPFRFLHDLVTSIMRETGYLQGLFTSEELNPDNIKDRDGKIAFLEKLIAAVKLSTESNISARPTKIVAGLEVEKTNELLQIIGKALEKKIDSSVAVEQIVNKGSKKVSQSKIKEVSKSKSKKDAVIEESKTKEKTDVKKKKPSTRTKDNAVKESTSTSKLSNKKDNKDQSSRKKERSPTKAISNSTSKDKNITSNKGGVVKNDVLEKDEVKQTGNKSTKGPIEKSESFDEKPVLQRKSSVEKPTLQKRSSKENLIVTETSVDVNGNNDIDNENDVSLERVELLPVLENANENGKTNEDKEIEVIKKDQDLQETEREIKEDTPKMKRPSSAHHGHRRHSSARRTSDVDNGADPKSQVPSVPVADSTNSNVANATTTNESEEVQILGSSVVSETAVKVSPPLVARPRTAARPPSARPGAPRVRDRGHVEVVEDPKSPSVPVNLIVDAEGTKDEDDENLVVLESQPVTTEEQSDQPDPKLITDSTADVGLDGEEQGRLVAQILETQRELELSAGLSSKVEIEWEGGRKRDRETALKEVDRLRNAIQSLTRAANPLGKLIDFLQEDVDSMQRELIQWQKMNSQLAKEVQSEESLTETSLEPLKLQLEELDLLIQDELEKVSAVKANIIRNDERILKLLPGVQHS